MPASPFFVVGGKDEPSARIGGATAQAVAAAACDRKALLSGYFFVKSGNAFYDCMMQVLATGTI